MKQYVFILLITALGLGGCGLTTVDHRGYLADTADFAKVKPGMTRENVVEVLGSPSTLSNIREEQWFYITKQTERTAFFRPTTQFEQVLMVSFAPHGVVKETKVYQGEEARRVIPIKRTTKVDGYESTVMREIFSNFGKFGGQQPKKP